MSIGADFYREYTEGVVETWLKLFAECETVEDYEVIVEIIKKFVWM